MAHFHSSGKIPEVIGRLKTEQTFLKKNNKNGMVETRQVILRNLKHLCYTKEFRNLSAERGVANRKESQMYMEHI